MYGTRGEHSTLPGLSYADSEGRKVGYGMPARLGLLRSLHCSFARWHVMLVTVLVGLSVN